MELVMDFNRLNFDRLSDVREMISGILSTELAAETIDEKRIKTIADAEEKRIEIVKMRQR